MMTIQNARPRPTSPHPLLNLGFRIFFAGAAIFAIVAMVMWAGVLSTHVTYKPNQYLLVHYWHAHEMIFGYALAVIAGFLLTAVQTWTSQPMPYGYKLLLIFACWAMARIFFAGAHAMSTPFMFAAAFAFDIAFWLLTTFFVTQAVVRVRQKRQIGIVAKLFLLLMAHFLFYAGVFLQNTKLSVAGLYVAFYLVIAVVLTIGRRVLPFFIQKGVAIGRDGKPNGVVYEQNNSKLLDRLSLLFLLLFMIMVLLKPTLSQADHIGAICALGLFVVNAIRLVRWHHKGIWQKPLLWSLYLSFWGIAAAFLLFFVVHFAGIASSIALHFLALSGIGLTTLAMMARVSLGHTGRNIHKPPKLVSAMFVLFMLCIIARVLLPMMDMAHYTLWLMLSQVLWVLSFMLFCLGYLKKLAAPRVDGLFG